MLFHEGQLKLGFPHYDSEIEATMNEEGTRFEGTWTKAKGGGKTSTMRFQAQRRADAPGASVDVTAPTPAIEGRWKVQFSQSEDPAVGLFTVQDDGTATGTFLTTTGDYRYLGGHARGNKLELTCFDGAHAFLFQALLEGTSLRGDFYSSDRWHEQWTATLSPDFQLPDAYRQVQWRDGVPLSSLAFPDLQGQRVSLDAEALQGEARILYLFGSWCPNCHDATELLKTLHEEYGRRGLAIVGLAFEHGGNTERSRAAVASYRARHAIPWPILMAGDSAKAKATQNFGGVDRIRSYPTTIFIDAAGSVRAVHSGFTGPATGAAFEHLQASFRRHLEAMLYTGWMNPVLVER